MAKRLICALFLLLTLVAGRTFAQLSPSPSWAVRASGDYRVFPNLTYLVASNQELKLDVYQRTGVTSPQPTLMFIHGGFWTNPTYNKDQSVMAIMPWLEMGWNVVNVDYRLARVALAPAAVEDCLCALRYVGAQSKTYNIDINRIVVAGESAGGHLALTTGMIPDNAGLDRQCAGAPLPKAAAVINWYGVTDVADVMDGPHRQNLAMRWMGSLQNRNEISRRVSPLTYVRAGLPPILSIHGSADQAVPHEHAVRLHEALSKAGASNQLLTIPKGGHGNFSSEERATIFVAIREFLAKNGLGGN